MNKLTINEKLNLEEILNLSMLISNRLDRISYNKTNFSEDDFIRDGFIPSLMHIGETINHLPPDLAETITNGNAKQIIGMRNRLAHAYLGVDTAILWNTLTESVPELGITTAQTLERLFDEDVSQEVAVFKNIQHNMDKQKQTAQNIDLPKSMLSISKQKDNKGLER